MQTNHIKYDIQQSLLMNSEYHFINEEHINNRYVTKSLKGSGSFGKVIKAYDNLKNKFVALKVIHNNKDTNRIAKYEITILKQLKTLNITNNYPFVNLIKYFKHRNYIFMVFPLYHMNLYELIAHTNMQGISLRVVRNITIQLLVGLCKLREFGIIHCDLKPENIMLVNSTSCQIKIIDFGSATSIFNKTTYTYIQSRFYRAPEIILQLNYKCSIDMWSLATILVELHCGVPLFEGENEHDQLVRMVNLVGMPPLEMIWNSPRIFQFFEATKDKSNFILKSSIQTKCKPNSNNLENVFEKTCTQRLKSPDHTEERYKIFFDFIEKILRIDPKKRIHPSFAMNHPFVEPHNTPSNKIDVTLNCNCPTHRSSNIISNVPKMNNDNIKVNKIMLTKCNMEYKPFNNENNINIKSNTTILDQKKYCYPLKKNCSIPCENPHTVTSSVPYHEKHRNNTYQNMNHKNVNTPLYSGNGTLILSSDSHKLDNPVKRSTSITESNECITNCVQNKAGSTVSHSKSLSLDNKTFKKNEGAIRKCSKNNITRKYNSNKTNLIYSFNHINGEI